MNKTGHNQRLPLPFLQAVPKLSSQHVSWMHGRLSSCHALVWPSTYTYGRSLLKASQLLTMLSKMYLMSWGCTNTPSVTFSSWYLLKHTAIDGFLPTKPWRLLSFAFHQLIHFYTEVFLTRKYCNSTSMNLTTLSMHCNFYLVPFSWLVLISSYLNLKKHATHVSLLAV